MSTPRITRESHEERRPRSFIASDLSPIGPVGELAVLVLNCEQRLVGYADLPAEAAGVPPLTAYPAP